MPTTEREIAQTRKRINGKACTSRRIQAIGLRAIFVTTIAVGLMFWFGATAPVNSHGTAKESVTTPQSGSYCIYNNSRSTIEVQKAFEVASKDRGRYRCETKFPGSFKDPRNGGECWKCPNGFGRTLFAVTSAKACKRGTFGKPQRATLVGKPGCAPGAWRDMLSDYCRSCPVGYKRRAHLRSALDLKPNACIAEKTFAHRLKPKEQACSDEFRNNASQKVKFFMALVPEGVKQTEKYCRWAKTDKIPTPEPAPGLTPKMKCPLFQFEIPGTGSAKVIGGVSGGFRLALLTHRGEEYDWATNGYREVPAPGKTGRR